MTHCQKLLNKKTPRGYPRSNSKDFVISSIFYANKSILRELKSNPKMLEKDAILTTEQHMLLMKLCTRIRLVPVGLTFYLLIACLSTSQSLYYIEYIPILHRNA